MGATNRPLEGSCVLSLWKGGLFNDLNNYRTTFFLFKIPFNEILKHFHLSEYYTVKGTPVERVSYYKYFGFWLVDKLRFKL